MLYSISSPKRVMIKPPAFSHTCARNTHIKAARMKLANAFFIAADAAGGKRRGHGVADGFLRRGKRRVRVIRAAIGIQPVFGKLNRLQFPGNLQVSGNRNQK